MRTEVFRDLSDCHSGLTTPRDAHNVITHVITQLPYVLAAAACAALGYVALALSGSVLLGLAVVGIALVLFTAVMKATTTPVTSSSAAEAGAR